jgi:predicted nuclease with TOPRIM domain
MSDLESLEKRLDKVENRVDKLEDDIGDIKITNGRTEEKLNNIEKIVTKLNDITIPGLIEKIDNLNLKSHFDWMELIKNKGMPFLIVGGIVYFILKTTGIVP